MGRPKGSGGNLRPDRKEATSLKVDKGDNTKIVANCMWCRMLPEIDTTDPVQVENRINEYIQHCIEFDIKPTTATCALAIGVSRQTFNNWGRGRYRKDTHFASIKKAYDFMGSLMEEYMVNGKINPVTGIFLMKNNNGYSDQQEVVLTPNNPLGDSTPPEDLQEKYLEAANIDDD